MRSCRKEFLCTQREIYNYSITDKKPDKKASQHVLSIISAEAHHHDTYEVRYNWKWRQKPKNKTSCSWQARNNQNRIARHATIPHLKWIQEKYGGCFFSPLTLKAGISALGMYPLGRASGICLKITYDINERGKSQGVTSSFTTPLGFPHPAGPHNTLF